MKGVSGDAVENKEANHAISSSDCVIHEVFGSVLGAECMTRLLSNIGDNTVVIPDTAGTFFKLCSFSSQNVLDMINVRSKQTIHIYRKVSYVRGLDLSSVVAYLRTLVFWNSTRVDPFLAEQRRGVRRSHSDTRVSFKS